MVRSLPQPGLKRRGWLLRLAVEAVSWAASWAVSDKLPWLSVQLVGGQRRSYTFTTASSTRLPPAVASWGALLPCASDAGFGKELFTDAGKYVIHFGSSPQEAAEQVATAVQAAHPDKPPPPVTALARVRTDVSVIPTSTGARLAGSAAVGLVQEWPVQSVVQLLWALPLSSASAGPCAFAGRPAARILSVCAAFTWLQLRFSCPPLF